MTISKTLKVPKTAVPAAILAMCDFVKGLEDSGDYLNAAAALGSWWQDIGVRPAVDKLPPEKKASILARVGSLSSSLGSMQQAPGAQEKAKDLIGEAATLFDSIGDASNWAETKSDLAICYWREGANSEARAILENALESGAKLPPQLEGKLLLRRVNVEISAGDLPLAMTFIEKAFPLVEKFGGDLLLGKLYFHHGLVLQLMGEQENDSKLLLSAADNYRKARQFYKRAKHDLYGANVETNLGNVFRLLGDHKAAITHLDKAIFLYVKLRDQSRAASVYDNKAHVYLALNNLKDAEFAARQSVSLLREGDEQAVLAESLTTLGIVLSRQRNFADAIHSFVEAKEAALHVGDMESAGNAVLTQLEELQSDLSPTVFRSLYLEADELLKRSPKLNTLDRLQAIARKQFEVGKIDPEESADSQKMAKLLSYADKLDTLFEDKAGVAWENFSLPDAVRSYEGEIIQKALNESGGRVTKAAKLLGLSHQNLSLILHQRHHELKKYCVQRKPRSKSKVKTH